VFVLKILAMPFVNRVLDIRLINASNVMKVINYMRVLVVQFVHRVAKHAQQIILFLVLHVRLLMS